MVLVCEICGDKYEGRAGQKYCPECGKNPNAARARYTKAVNRSKYHAGVFDEPKTRICKECGSEFKTCYGRSFCSKTCETKYYQKKATCTNCGKNLYDAGVSLEGKNLWGVRFCCDECRDEYRIKNSKSKNEVRICKYCGKEYTNRNAAFCSKDCYNKAKEEGWKPEKAITKRMSGTTSNKTTAICKICKKPFETDKDIPAKCCSKECWDEYGRRYKLYLKKKKEEQAEEKRKKEIEEKGLCLFCKTPYKKCVRMTSDFTLFPEGSVHKGGIVTSCPLFK